MILRVLILLCAVPVFSRTAFAESTPELTLGVLLDTYAAHESPDPGGRARAYTTQALYQDEPYVNLASAGLTLTTESFRARAAGHWGSSVTSNYAAEPDEAWQYVQESYAGYQLADGVWLDAGIFLSHIGPEGWSSKDGLTYTRSFIAEFSPYYESGFRLSGNLTEKLSGQLFLVRGWQNISDGRPLALGSLLTYSFSDTLSISHSSFLGDENGTRFFNDVYVKWRMHDRLEIIAAYDAGYQNLPGDYAWWSGWAAIGRYRIIDELAAAIRVERFSDPSGIVAASAREGSYLSVTGGSLTLDYTPVAGVLMRAEYRPIFASNAIFPDDSGFLSSSQLFVISISTWIDQLKLL